MVSSHSFYDALASDYSNLSKERATYLESINIHVINAIEFKNPSALLDIGSGDGARIHKLVRNRNIDVWVLENSVAMSDLLSRYFDNDRILRIDVLKISNLPKQFDMITALWNVFGHIQEVERIFAQIKNNLSQEGVFIFDVNNPFNVAEYGLISVIRNWWIINVQKKILFFSFVRGAIDTPVYFRSLSSYRDMLRRAGFTTIKVSYVNYSTGRRTIQFCGQLFVECS